MSLLDQIKAGLATETPFLNVSPELELWTQPAATSVPASGNAQTLTTLNLPDTFARDDALLLSNLFGALVPGDATGSLTITDLVLFISEQGGLSIIDIATPLLTTLVPRFGTSLMFYPPPLIQMRSLNQIDQLRNATQMASPTALALNLRVGLHNSDAGGAHTMQVSLGCIYRHVRGLREG